MPVDITQVPHQLGLALGVSDFVAGIIASIILFTICALPLLFLTRGKNFVLSLCSGMLIVSFCIALGWLPIWLFAVLALLIALMFADKISKMMS